MTSVSKVNPFSPEFLADPYPFHEELRACLMDWETFCSSAGVGLSDFRKETPWRPPSLILEADPPLHTRTRAVLTRILSAAAMKRLWTTFEQDAIPLVERLVERGTFDAIKDLAEVYPLKVFPDAVGLAEEGRENLLPYGNMAFNAFGPRNDTRRATAFTGRALVTATLQILADRPEAVLPLPLRPCASRPGARGWSPSH